MQGNVAPISSDSFSVSVIVPVHKDGVPFRRCISSLAGTTPQPDEVILISDGAGDSIDQLAGEFGFSCFHSPAGSGPAKARNMGASQAVGNILFFVDSDVTVPQDCIARIREAFAHDPQTIAVFGSYDDEPSEPNFLSQFKNLVHHYVHQNAHEQASTFWGACGSIRRKAFLELGGFDERYRRPCVEDIEFGYRIRKAGYKMRLLKTLQVKHLKKWGIVSLVKSDLLDRALPWTELILRDREMINDLNLHRSQRLSAILVLLFAGLSVAALWKPIFAGISLVFFAAVLIINLPLYRFFYRRRGFLFMLGVIPWHIIYYLCCIAGFAAGFALARIRKARALLS